MADELRCHDSWSSTNRCANEAVWALSLKPRDCGHSWYKAQVNVEGEPRPSSTQLYCDKHVAYFVDWYLSHDGATCPECSMRSSPRSCVVRVERL